MPNAAGDFCRQAMSQLAGKHHNLSAVMAFMRDEVAKNVTNVERKVAPYIGGRGGNASTLITAELQEAQYARAATLQRWNKVLRFHLVPVHIAWHCDAVF